MSTPEPQIVVLSARTAGERLVEAARDLGLVARRCRSFERLLQNPRLSSASVLVIDLDPSGCKAQLGAIGRIAFESPHIQMIAICNHAPSTVVGAYLTSCSVELIRGRLSERNAREIAFFVSLVHERQSWSLDARPA